MDKIQKELRNLVREKNYLFIEKDESLFIDDHIRFIPEGFSSIPKPVNAKKFTKVAWIEFKCKPKSSVDIFNSAFLGSLFLLLVVRSKVKDNQTEIMFQKAHQRNGIKLDFFNSMGRAEDAVEKGNQYVHFHAKCLLSVDDYNNLLLKNESEIKDILSNILNKNISEFEDRLNIISSK